MIHLAAFDGDGALPYLVLMTKEVRGRVLIDPPASERQVPFADLRRAARGWDRTIAAIPGGSVLFRPSPTEVATRDGAAIAAWASTMTESDRKALASPHGLSIKAIPEGMRDFLIRRSPDRKATEAIIEGSANVLAMPLAFLKGANSGGKPMAIRCAVKLDAPELPAVIGSASRGEAREGEPPAPPWTSDPLPDAVAGALDFGEGELLPLEKIMAKATSAFRRTFVIDGRASKTEYFLKGRWDERSLLAALEKVARVNAPTPTISLFDRGDTVLLPKVTPAPGEYALSALFSRLEGLEELADERGLSPSTRVTLTTGMNFIVTGRPMPFANSSGGAQGYSAYPYTIIVE